MLEARLFEEAEDHPNPHLDDERQRYCRIAKLGAKGGAGGSPRMSELVKLAASTFGITKHA